MKCFACGGPYHPASGHAWTAFGVVYCGPCARHFLTWMKGHVAQRRRGFDFYGEAATSIRAGVFPPHGHP